MTPSEIFDTIRTEFPGLKATRGDTQDSFYLPGMGQRGRVIRIAHSGSLKLAATALRQNDRQTDRVDFSFAGPPKQLREYVLSELRVLRAEATGEALQLINRILVVGKSEGQQGEPIAASLLKSLKREHVLEALRRIEGGEPTDFAESTRYDLLFEGRRYPPKRVAGLALEVMTSTRFGPKSFKGGAISACFAALQTAGFTIAPKSAPDAHGNLVGELAEVLELQKAYSWKNTPEMQRRGQLIRVSIPALLWQRVELLEPLFSSRGYSFSIEGSDGAGRKGESPWVRIYDPVMAPSATTGWYVVIHFSRDGQRVYVTLGCGATTYRDGGLVPIPAEELSRRVNWAKALPAADGFVSGNFTDQIELKGGDLSTQFERATAFAKQVLPQAIREDHFFELLGSLIRQLVSIYEAQRQGKDPVGTGQDVIAAEEEAAEVISPRRVGRRGQGRGLSSMERIAVERRAMDVAREGLILKGFTEIEDVSGKESYDFAAILDGVEWFVEVKGTTSQSSDQFLLTAAELLLHRSKPGVCALALVRGVQLDQRNDGPTASGGTLLLEAPWNLDDWDFAPTAYRAVRSRAST